MTPDGSTVGPSWPLSAPGITEAAPQHRAVLCRTLGRAFHDDPVWRWLVRGRRYEQRSGKILALLADVFRHLGGHVLMTPSGESVAVWTPPEVAGPKSGDYVRIAAPAARAFGIGGLRRLPLLAPLEAKHPREPHWYLAILGTDPAHQRRGHASRLLEPALAAADADGVGCYLESSKADNVPYYRRHGFEVTEELTVGGVRGPTMWLMWRDPR